ncbi:energy-coupling factor transporter transmembrane component T family protein [Haloarcula nitratireducens]|uniref:Energy-coupling factor transporter transmembrane protein EcfT n=1 Tax=Haloarcula nitratireducens TaxID=2487749 RepID=A0AAW4PCF1_9EURY|nr:energy-coupling factor transporter transmembrane component T [Halomicroarcula nitratireducens]MBX0295398.1 energy-coupling factor transporter transmembrane protein EcfT [Halomicroarcula nitratireducens]
MLSYRPGNTVVHRLDPRSKLLAQFGLAVAVVAHPTAPWLAGATLLSLLVLAAARLSPFAVVRSYRVVFAVLALAPLLAGIALGSPWFRVEPALRSARLVARVVPVLFVSAAYLTTTPVRETRAAVQRLVPGKPGQLLGVGMALVVRLFPVVLGDVREVRDAMLARGGERRPVWVRARLLAVRSLDRTLARSDRLSVALRARCFAWNPTLPPLSFERRDYPVLALGIALALSPATALL